MSPDLARTNSLVVVFLLATLNGLLTGTTPGLSPTARSRSRLPIRATPARDPGPRKTSS
jgi:hypothetical protein